MPFTLAHTAVVLPFVRWKHASATALIAGSMAPDFEYFFKLSVDGVHGHTLAGLFYFDLPVSIGLCLLFHSLVKKNLILNLPRPLQGKFRATLDLDFFKTLRLTLTPVVVCSLFGSATHILWDAFTHGTGFFVRYFSFYDGAYVPFQGVKYPLWYALQHFSTFIGLSVVAVYVWWMKNGPPISVPRLRYWVILTGISLLVVGIRFMIYHDDYNLGNLVVSGISGICIALLCCGLIPFHNRPIGSFPEKT